MLYQLDALDLLAQIPNAMPGAFAFADPPWGCGKQYYIWRDGRRCIYWKEPMLSSERYWNGHGEWSGLCNVWAELQRITPHGGYAILMQPDRRNLKFLPVWFRDCESRTITVQGGRMVLHERIIIWRKGAKPEIPPHIPTFRFHERSRHVCEKPVEFAEWVIDHFAPRNGILIDPFAGSGNHLVGAINKGLRYLGGEKYLAPFRMARAALDRATRANSRSSASAVAMASTK